MADLANSTVNTPCLAYKKMAIHRELIDDLLGGTLSMRKAGTKWLPKETKEEQGSYENRLKRSTLFNAYKDTTDSLSGKPFSKAVDLKSKDNLPDGLAEIADNCDMQGTNLTQFAKEIFDTLLNRGLTHILTDYPKTFSADGKELTIAEENAAGVRPYFVHIKPEQLIGWRYEITSNGKFRLTQIRWKTSVIEADGPYGEKAVEEIRVMTPTTIEVHRQNDKGDFVVASTGEHTFGEIPLTTCYINKKGFMVAEPPLEGLAWLNLDHWQSSSDQKNLLRFARCPIAFISGLSKQEVDENFVFAAGSIFSSTNADADAKYLEHTGAAIGAGRTDILDIEERMIILGLEPLLSKTGNQTATGQSIDTANTQCAIQAWIQALEMALLNAYKLAAQWIGVELPEDFKIDIFNNFGISLRASADILALIQIRLAKEIDRETFLYEIKRRGLLSETANIPEIMSAAESEGPSLADIGMGDSGGNKDFSQMSDKELIQAGIPFAAIKQMREIIAKNGNNQE